MTANVPPEVRPHVLPRKDFFDQVLSTERRAGRSAASFATSLAIQCSALAVLTLVPLMATDQLPTPEGIDALLMPPPPAPPPAPRAPAPARAARAPAAVVPVLPAAFVPPVAVPDAIPSGDLAGGDPFAGVEGGVEGGVPAGVIVGMPGSFVPKPPKPPEPVRIGGEIRPPRKIHHVDPVYPAIAREARVEGIVILEAVLDATGAVTNLRVLRSIPLLDRAAVEAVRQWRYEPTRLNGVDVPVVMTVTVDFRLQR